MTWLSSAVDMSPVPTPMIATTMGSTIANSEPNARNSTTAGGHDADGLRQTLRRLLDAGDRLPAQLDLEAAAFDRLRAVDDVLDELFGHLVGLLGEGHLREGDGAVPADLARRLPRTAR